MEGQEKAASIGAIRARNTLARPHGRRIVMGTITGALSKPVKITIGLGTICRMNYGLKEWRPRR